MTRTVWFNCCAGVAGDMLLASLMDAGADRLDVMSAWAALDLDGFAATWERVQRCGVASLWTNIALHDHDAPRSGQDSDPTGGPNPDQNEGGGHSHPHLEAHSGSGSHAGSHAHSHRPAREVLALIEHADLPERVRADASAVYSELARVEGAIHGQDPDDVELHEVGALDSILDVVGVCAALHSLGLERITYSPIAVGHGTVMTAHGRLPNPVPAVSRLLAAAEAATVGLDTTMELATPTGVALLTVLGTCGPLPSMTVQATGFGAGTADPPGRPNVVQAIIGTREHSSAAPERPVGRPCQLLETNVDDATGEVLAHTVDALLAAGAYDAWVTPIVMKKGRPAHTISALVDDGNFDRVRAALVSESGTLGVRSSTVHRWPQQRTETSVDVDGHAIRVKLGEHRIKVEHDDASAAARALGLPLRTVLARAEALADAAD